MSFYVFDLNELRCARCHKPCRRVRSSDPVGRTVRGKEKTAKTKSNCCGAAVYTGFELNVNQASEWATDLGFHIIR